MLSARYHFIGSSTSRPAASKSTPNRRVPDPSPDYRKRQDLGPEDTATLILDGIEVARIAVRDLLPRI